MDTYLGRFYHDSCEFIVRKGASKHSISQKLNISEQWGIKWLFWAERALQITLSVRLSDVTVSLLGADNSSEHLLTCLRIKILY